MKNKNPLISIIIPVYNSEKYINRCIENIFAQTYKNYEIILVDDGSTDNCPEICDNYERNYNNIIVTHLKNTKAGVSDARNAGLKLSKGKYITFIDSDDFVHESLLMVLLTAIIKTGVKLSMCSYKKVYNSNIETNSTFNKKDLQIIDDMQAMDLILNDQTYSACWGKLFDIKLFENLEFEVDKFNEDMLLVPLIFRRAKQIVSIPVPLYYYSQEGVSLVRASFNYHKLDMAEAKLLWKKQAELFYPTLVEKAKISYFSTLINLCQYIADKKDEFGKQQFKLYRMEIIQNFKFIISSKYSTKNNKLKLILFKLGLFRLTFISIEFFNIRKYDVGF